MFSYISKCILNYLMLYICTDLDVRQMENAAILASSWQRPALIIDPYDEGSQFISQYSKSILRRSVVAVDDNVYVSL